MVRYLSVYGRRREKELKKRKLTPLPLATAIEKGVGLIQAGCTQALKAEDGSELRFSFTCSSGHVTLRVQRGVDLMHRVTHLQVVDNTSDVAIAYEAINGEGRLDVHPVMLSQLHRQHHGFGMLVSSMLRSSFKADGATNHQPKIVGRMKNLDAA